MSQVTEEVEVTEEQTVEELERQLLLTTNGLRRIARIRANQFAGGVSNKNFGRRFEQAFKEAQKDAVKTLAEIGDTQFFEEELHG